MCLALGCCFSSGRAPHLPPLSLAELPPCSHGLGWEVLVMWALHLFPGHIQHMQPLPGVCIKHVTGGFWHRWGREGKSLQVSDEMLGLHCGREDHDQISGKIS